MRVTEEYNKSATQAADVLAMKDVKRKNKGSIERKLLHLKKKKELVYLVLEEQINCFIKDLGNNETNEIIK
jgi:hypothetical protein